MNGAANYQEKFLVLHFKRFGELNDHTRRTTCNCREAYCIPEPTIPHNCREVKNFFKALNVFREAYKKRVGKKTEQKYYVCNQDEPYANKIINIILEGEKLKCVPSASGAGKAD